METAPGALPPCCTVSVTRGLACLPCQDVKGHAGERPGTTPSLSPPPAAVFSLAAVSVGRARVSGELTPLSG